MMSKTRDETKRDAKKVFVTGMGTVSSLGIGVDESFAGLLAGRSAVQRMDGWDQYNGLHSHLGAPVPAYDIKRVPRSARRTMSRMSEMATIATLEALAQAGLRLELDAAAPDPYRPRILLCLGSTTGSPESMEAYFRKLFEMKGPEGQMGTNFFKVMNHSIAANVAAALSFHGAALSPSCACATSAQAAILGWELIQSGAYDIVIAGGGDELHYTSAAVFDTVFAASRNYNDRPELAPRPFDASRDGLVVSEGASIVVLESAESMARRGSRALAELKSGAYLCNGSHMSQSDASTMSEVMRHALDRAGCDAADVDYVNAHATGTVQGDQAECAAIAAVVGEKTPVSSLKGHLGHSLAACGTFELIASIQMIERGVLIPTRNLETVADDCRGVRHLQSIQNSRPKLVLSNNFAFGGVNTCLVVSAI